MPEPGFVTDEVKGIVPDFLMFAMRVIDSPDIPLNRFLFLSSG